MSTKTTPDTVRLQDLNGVVVAVSAEKADRLLAGHGYTEAGEAVSGVNAVDEMKVAELKVEAANRGLATSGTKAELIEAIKAYDAGTVSEADATAPAEPAD